MCKQKFLSVLFAYFDHLFQQFEAIFAFDVTGIENHVQSILR